ncbi:MAG: diacylglycerol kinase family protein [Candidatus Pacebacteria bacterium]|nr:diacylglycerol kinase family protein [Candidatus Paceibacterota bacterium]
MEKMSEKKRFSLVARFKSTNHGLRGLGVFLRTTHNLWLHLFFTALAIYMGFLLSLSSVEWAIIIFAVGLVLITEAINTAIEIDIDLTSPNYHPYAKDTKDVAAGAVSIATIVAGIMGLLIFLPKVLVLL